MQTLWHRTRDERWLRLTQLLRDAVPDQLRDRRRDRPRAGVRVRDELVGLLEVRRQRLRRAARDRGAGGVHARGDVPRLWIFGWDRLSPRLHLATLWVAVVGTWMSGYFILVANSWMQHPVGYKLVNGEAQLTSVWALMSNGFALRAYVHTMLAGLIFGSIVMLGICCWQFLRRQEVDLFLKAAKLALIVAVPVTFLQLVVGNRFGAAVTSAQSMKIAASEAQWDTCQPCGFLALPDRRFHCK
jgi:cytochrome d ubiquinol oxidase subunit I